MADNYYVYVYIDPRNHEEFYYGKGKGSRKDAHLKDKSDTEKANQIRAIRKEGLEPIIRVIARNLTSDEAFLVEKTLLWKLGKWTTNISRGQFKKKFRPHNALHKKIHGFDYTNGFYYYNVGEGKGYKVHRNWDDYRKYGFISAGQGKQWGYAMRAFNEGDVFAAYLKRRGFVGIGRILETAKRVNEVIIKGKPLLSLPLKCPNMAQNCEDEEKSEYVCKVKWLRKVPREKAKMRYKPKLFTTTHIRASLENQRKTVAFLEKAFRFKLKRLLKRPK